MEVIDSLPPHPILDLMENSGPGRKLSEQESMLCAFQLSQMDEVWVPKKPHAVYRLLKDNHRCLATLCRFGKVPSWETFRKRFQILKLEYSNEVAIRMFEIREELRKRACGKKALPIIAKHQAPRRRHEETPRSNHQYRQGRIDRALGLVELFNLVGTDDLAEAFFIMARYPHGKFTCPRPGCGSDRVVDLPGEQLQQWLCLDCEEPFDIKTATVFEGTRYSLRTILLAACHVIQSPFGVTSLDLACLLKEEGQRLSHKDALDLTHRIQVALVEPRPLFAGPVQTDESLMGYATGVRANVLGVVDWSSGRAYVEPAYGPVDLQTYSAFIDSCVDEEAEIHSDSAKNIPKKPRRRKMVNHARRELARDDKDGGPRISTNLAENFWSTFQEMLDRRRAVTSRYLPLYLAEHLWRYNHSSEPIVDQLKAFICNAHEVVLRGDDKLLYGDQLVMEELAVQLALLPPHPKERKARAKAKRTPSSKKPRSSQLKMF